MEANTIVEAVAAGVTIVAAALAFAFTVARYLESRRTRLEQERVDKAYRARNARMSRRK